MATRPPMMLTVHRRAWLRRDLAELLAQRFELDVREVSLPFAPQRTARVMSKPGLLLTELVFFVRLVLGTPARRGTSWGYACFGGHLATLAYCRLMRLTGRRDRVYLLNFYLHALGERAWVKAILRLLMSDDVRIIAQTRADASYFRQFVPADHIELAPYTRIQDEFVDASTARFGDYVFSGGWTNRDYGALFRCARALPDVPFVVVASAHSGIREARPANVTLYTDLEPAEFDRLIADSRFVVIPLEADVGSSGQMVLLAAMEYAKATVVPDLGAVLDFVEHGETGVVYPHGDDRALAAAVARLHADADEARTLGQAARARFLRRFVPANFSRPVAAYLSAE